MPLGTQDFFLKFLLSAELLAHCLQLLRISKVVENEKKLHKNQVRRAVQDIPICFTGRGLEVACAELAFHQPRLESMQRCIQFVTQSMARPAAGHSMQR